MELTDYLNTLLLYFALVIALGVAAIVFFLMMKRGNSQNSTKTCPHCQQIIDIKQNVCNFCHRTIT